MLLRSSSTPILNSWIHSSRESSPDNSDVSLPKLSRTRSGSVSFPISSSFNPADHKIPKPTSDLDIQQSFLPKKNTIFRPHTVPKPVRVKEKVDPVAASHNPPSPMVRILSSSGGGGGGGEGRGTDGRDGFGGSYHDNTDAYYRNMIEANPSNALLLANYARFLKEVKKDYEKAEEYCGRAILANPTDGNVLSLYADLVWQIHKDANRAEAYFEQAVKINPTDCYVAASYARFLWDVDDEDDEEENNIENEDKGVCETGKETTSSPMIFGGTTHRSPLTAGS